MVKQTIDIGTSANKGDGDPLRVAFDKINDNFDELYARDTGADPSAFASSLIPSADNTYNLGSEAKQWSDAYIQDFLYLGGVRLSTDSNGNLIIGGTIQQKVDVVASVFADDSTLLVDGVAGKIVGNIETTFATITSGLTVENIYAQNSFGVNITAGGNNNLVVTQSAVTIQNVALNPTAGITGYISVADLQTLVAASTDFADFQSRIAAL